MSHWTSRFERAAVGFMAVAAIGLIMTACDMALEDEDVVEEELVLDKDTGGALVEIESSAAGEATIVRDAEGGQISTQAQATYSFWATCEHPKYARWDGNPIVRAYGHNCKRRNGTKNPYSEYNGRCYTDVSNCDGNLVCQSSCP